MGKKLQEMVKAAASGQSPVTVAVDPKMLRRTGRHVEHRVIKQTTMPEVRDQIIRIHHECDPIGFLMDVVNGVPIETVLVTGVDRDGRPLVTKTYETATVKERIKAAESLADKYMPKMAVVNHSHLHRLPTQAGDVPDGATNFAQMISMAAKKSAPVIDGEMEDGPQEDVGGGE